MAESKVHTIAGDAFTVNHGIDTVIRRIRDDADGSWVKFATPTGKLRIHSSKIVAVSEEGKDDGGDVDS